MPSSLAYASLSLPDGYTPVIDHLIYVEWAVKNASQRFRKRPSGTLSIHKTEETPRSLWFHVWISLGYNSPSVDRVRQFQAV